MPTGLGLQSTGKDNGMLKRIGRWTGLVIVLSVVMGCQSLGGTVYVYQPRRAPTPSYEGRDQRVRYQDYYQFYNAGGYQAPDDEGG